MATRNDRQTHIAGVVKAAKLDKLAATLKRQPAQRQGEAIAMLTALQQQLKDAITDSGRTHYAIGKEAGIRPDLLDRFMSGERDLRLATAGKIAAVLGYVLTKTESEKPALSAATKRRQRQLKAAKAMRKQKPAQ